MLHSARELDGSSVHATDGEIGDVEDLFFDDQHWTTRYVVVRPGNWLTTLDRVLISPMSVRDWSGDGLSVDLSRDQVKNSPSVAEDEPVSRQFERSYYGYYGWPFYWGGAYPWGAWATPAALAAAPMPAGPEGVAEQDEADEGDPHLRSASEVIGYKVQALDDGIGHVEDLLVHHETWEVRYVVVDTSDLWFGKKVIIAPGWIRDINWGERGIGVDHSTEEIKNSPEWSPGQPITDEYEQALRTHYGRAQD